jgi:riboflavin kinase/FMN adenylyltransferase
MKEILQKKLNVKHLLIGYDHRFGKNREENFDDYRRYGQEIGITVTQTPSYKEDGHTISSSFIRRLLDVGDVRSAAHYLRYLFTLKGTVVEGFKLGRILGFPTANLRLSFQYKYVPTAGVYAVRTEVDGERYDGMLYIGNRPTVANGEEISIEVNLFDFQGDLYNKELIVTFVDKVRGEEKFSNLDSLKEQLKRDKEAVEKVLELYNESIRGKKL